MLRVLNEVNPCLLDNLILLNDSRQRLDKYTVLCTTWSGVCMKWV